MTDEQRARGWFLSIGVPVPESDVKFLAAEYAKVRADERDECAKEADYYAKNSPAARSIAAAIRARGRLSDTAHQQPSTSK